MTAKTEQLHYIILSLHSSSRITIILPSGLTICTFSRLSSLYDDDKLKESQ